MSLQIPDFQGRTCVAITACGEVNTEDERLIKILEEKKARIARFEIAGRAFFLRCCTGGAKNRHLHVDCAAGEYFPEKQRPKPDWEKDELIEFVSQFEGVSIALGVVGAFDLPLDELPETGSIRSLGKGEQTGDVSIKLTRGRFTISGAPIEHIDWSIRDDGKRVRIWIEGDSDETVGEEYLQRTYEWLESQLSLFVKEKVSRLEQKTPVVVPIVSLAPEPYEVTTPFHVIVRGLDEEFVATFYDAQISASGATETEAVANVKDMIVATLEILLEHEDEALARGASRQREILQSFFRLRQQACP